MAMIAQFGGALLFWAVYAIAGLKPAIAATLLLLVAEVARRAWRRERPSALFVALTVLSALLGMIDLLATSPIAIRYDGVVHNLVFAALFGIGSLRATPIVQTFAEAARGPFPTEDPARTSFFRWFGWFWAGYFVSRALVCLLTGLWLALPEALFLRSVYAMVTIVPMVALSLGGKRLYLAMRRRGWFAELDSHRVGTGSAPE